MPKILTKQEKIARNIKMIETVISNSKKVLDSYPDGVHERKLIEIYIKNLEDRLNELRKR